MIVDETSINKGIDVSILAKLIERHTSHLDRYIRLKKYYLGEHAIKQRQRTSDGVANNKVVCNHAKYITDMMQSYLVGNPVTYAPSEGYDIEELKNAYLEQDIASLDSELVKDMSIYGRAYELIYADEESRPKSVSINPEQAFVVYSNDCTHVPMFGVYYYKTYSISGYCTGAVCNVYDKDNSYTYESNTDNWNSMVLTAQMPHFFGNVPLIEYRNNREKQGDFEQVISLIDAYNILMSDRVNDKEQFVDAFLLLAGIEVDGDQARKLKAEKILLAPDGGKAEYLSKVLSESDIKVLRDNIKEDIHRFSMVPDLSDDSFGGNLSGVAIKYKLLGFEQVVKNKERYLAKSLKKRFEAYNKFLGIKGQMSEVPIHRVDIAFTRNLPVNNLEVAQMINHLCGTVTQETLLDQLDFVADPKEEANLARKEQQEKQKEHAKFTEDLLGYTRRVKYKDEK
jgi:SPP1 family phage portal protein|nr:MAG TPA: PORTAL PROTEIN [Caudoviricetes sp.]